MKYTSLVFVIVMLSCTTPSEKTILMDLASRENALICQLHKMKNSINAEWDHINAMLDKNLPSEMPEEEKENMLEVRNAELIRMFQSFDKVDEDIKEALRKAEMKDKRMSKKIIVLKDSLRKIESKKYMLYEDVLEKEGREDFQKIKATYNKKLEQDCK